MRHAYLLATIDTATLQVVAVSIASEKTGKITKPGKGRHVAGLLQYGDDSYDEARTGLLDYLNKYPRQWGWVMPLLK